MPVVWKVRRPGPMSGESGMADAPEKAVTTGRHRALQVLAALLVAAWPASLAIAQDRVVHLSATDWPPYTGSDLIGGGASTTVVRRAFEKAGYQVKVFYDLWPKAIEMARKGSDDVVAYYPGYHCRHRAGFVASEPIGNGPLGFAEHVDAPLVWVSLDDIGERKLKIGTVAGYANTDEFDTKVGMGWIRAIPSQDDAESLRKLLRKRVDAAVIDKFVLEYLKATDDTIKSDAAKLRFNERLLEDKTLYLCFRDDEDGNRLRQAFDGGLEGIEADRIVADYFATAFPE